MLISGQCYTTCDLEGWHGHTLDSVDNLTYVWVLITESGTVFAGKSCLTVPLCYFIIKLHNITNAQ